MLGGLYWGGRRTRYIFWPGFLKIGISGFLKLKPAFALGDADWDRVWRYSTLSSVDIYSLKLVLLVNTVNGTTEHEHNTKHKFLSVRLMMVLVPEVGL